MKMKRILEIRAAVGGDDAKMLTKEWSIAYGNMAMIQGWNVEYL